MSERQIITKNGRPVAVVVPIAEWQRIEAALEDRADAAAVLAYLDQPGEVFPDAVLAAILDGTPPIKALREHRGLTQARLARTAGTSSVYISQIERGEREAGQALIRKLAKALKVDPELLASGGHSR
jgi:DNA-binding XRE family transcriptional regulator